ncbi:hypothetical protein ACQ7CX_11210 [Chryseobacterium arthrosphaerae]|uniref:hypothetical protein n=1 Tax=Chryseobacterium arthrosphaerae TaxID=651561 RepID=UPI001BAFBB89|nr:hypothetical protein [Chryseobacterium arthrosphaerae]QUY54010.1 hypothetical protein I2F65_14055 [Chryseobacterium arthrosphaerae]
MKNIVIISLLLILTSCSKNKDYQIINAFLKTNNIKLKNLSNKPYYLENSLKYWEEKEFTDLYFSIKRNENYTIDTSLIKNKLLDVKSICTTKISKLLISNDAKRALIGIHEFCASDKKLTIYLLKKSENNWILETKISSISTLSH